ncbi:MobF family relaxase [Embleya scabrispora]|uniref:MobF family relaxase n=1 Tax=Embleya scabrispora TaxID=159449 RepID=UPI00037C079C|nr:MobF family relaxase [Embleya scabrispora]MYS81040.1 relaxase domain-containing protein [Streptomyces sp. SID5474]
MTLHKLGPNGWEYLVDSVSVADEGRGLGQDLVAYYAATDNPPGVWTGALAEVLGVAGTEAGREQIRNLFGHGRHPMLFREYARTLVTSLDAGATSGALPGLGPDVTPGIDPDALARALERHPSVVERVLPGADIAHRVNERMAVEGVDVTGAARTALRDRIRGEERAADARRVAHLARRLAKSASADERVLADVLVRASPAHLAAAADGLQLGRAFPVHRTVAERAATRFVAHAVAHPHATEAELAHAKAEILREEDTRGERQAVTGFDLVFSPPKSISTAWALAVVTGDDATRLALEEAHNDAVRAVLARLENDVAFTRLGAGGAAQVKADGVAAVAFVHRTSRAGDPDLHTHVIVSTKTLGPDGRWRSLDGRALFAAKVALSEQYNSTVLDGVTHRLGWATGVRADQVDHGSRAIRELVEIPVALNEAFSSRRAQVKAEFATLYRKFRETHGREPRRGEEYDLLQQATLNNRPRKDKGGTAAAEARRWREIAESVLGPGYATFLAGLTHTARTLRADDIGVERIAAWAAATVDGVQHHRSTWTVRNLEAEAQRVTRDTAFASSEDRAATVSRIVRLATAEDRLLDPDTGTRVVRITPDALIAEPAALRRPDGTGVFQPHAAVRYTSTAILDAERRLLAHARAGGAPTLSRAAVDAALAESAREHGRTLAPDQRAAVRHLAHSGTWLTSLIGPAGTGKTTTLRVLVRAAELDGWTVVGLAPSARAARVLADTAGIATTENTHQWAAQLRGGAVAPHPRTLVLIDEAGMAGTLTLDAITRAHVAAGGVVRLVGDPQQLAAVESGGVLRHLQRHADSAELTSVWRFREPDGTPRTWEIDASLRLRDGDTTVVEEYLRHGRVHDGSLQSMTDRVYRDWRADTAAGRVSLMIASTNALAGELSERARADRVAAGEVERDGVALANGGRAGVGDRVVTRRNERAMSLFAGRDWVKNGDVWEVTGRGRDGALTVRHTEHGGTITLPPAYVGSSVELAYASTTHRAQGMTVDVARALVSADLGRENLYVMATRGAAANHLYVVVDEGLDLDGHVPAGQRRTARQALTAVIARGTTENAAHDDIAAALTARTSLATLTPRYRYAHGLVSYRLDDEEQARAADVVREALPDPLVDRALDDEAWPALAYYIALAGTRDRDAHDTLTRALTQDFSVPPGEVVEEFAAVNSPAQLLAWRMEQRLYGEDKPPRSGTMPWLPVPPRPESAREHDTADVIAYARSTYERIEARAAHLAVAAVVAPGLDGAGDDQSWTVTLGALPETGVEREGWLRTAAAVAAYRETFEVRGPLPLDEPTEGESIVKTVARDHVAAMLAKQRSGESVVRASDGDRPGPGRDLAAADAPALDALASDAATLDAAALARAIEHTRKQHLARKNRAAKLHDRADTILARAEAGQGPAARGLYADSVELTRRVDAIERVPLLEKTLRAAHDRLGTAVVALGTGRPNSLDHARARVERARIERVSGLLDRARQAAGSEYEWDAVRARHTHLTRTLDLHREAAAAVDRATGLAVRADADRLATRAHQARAELDALQTELRARVGGGGGRGLGDITRALDAVATTRAPRRATPTGGAVGPGGRPERRPMVPQAGPELAP